MRNLRKNSKNQGYALYSAIILTGILILVSYAIANLSVKELLLSSSGADSHIAFYNTDTGLECALYWDVKNGATSAFDINTPGTVICNGQTITTGSQVVQTVPPVSSLIGGGGLGNPTSIFQLNLSPGCVIVQVTKNVDGSTTIQSRGYNTCTAGANRFERGVIIQY